MIGLYYLVYMSKKEENSAQRCMEKQTSNYINFFA